MQIHVETYDAANPVHAAALPDIANWGREQCVASPLDYAGRMRHLLGAVAIDRDGETVCGYGAIKRRWSASVVEFGGLVTLQNYRGRGAASAIVRHVLEAWQHRPADAVDTADPADAIPEFVIAFANLRSLGLFEKLGGQQLGSKEDYLAGPPPEHGQLDLPPGRVLTESLKNRALDLTRVR